MEETGEGGGGVGGGDGERGVERGKRDSSFKDSPTRVRAYPTSLKEEKLFIKRRKSIDSVAVAGVKKRKDENSMPVVLCVSESNQILETGVFRNNNGIEVS